VLNYNEENWDGDIIWVTPVDLGKLKSNFIINSERKITRKGYITSGTKLVAKNSIVMSTRAPIGHIGIANTILCTNQGCKSLVKLKNLNINYFYYFFESFKNILQSKGEGATFIELSGFNLKIFIIINPHLTDQDAIVRFLDEKIETIEK
jgi:type I restriction enzyme S subunit